MLAPLVFLTPGEILEAVDRLAARGFVKRVGPRGLHSGLCISVIDYGEGSSLRQAKCTGLSLQEFDLSKT
ncbi:hypothetical protein ACTPOK_39950 [Streptomyces inhibens]|uniref:hypothetical protein n=1 Tax=Streptomyces inhibens TaxID=2293571 RepID=UPI00402AF2B6